MGDRESLALKDWSTLRMSENYGGCDAGTAGQRFALPLQISDIGVAVSSRLPAFQRTFDSKCASQYLCFDVTPPFSSSMTRSPSTTLHRVFPQLFLTPPQPFGFTPHLSSHLLSHLLLSPRSSALLPALCPPNPRRRISCPARRSATTPRQGSRHTERGHDHVA